MSLQLTPVPNTLSALAERVWERMEPIWLTLDDASKQSALLSKDAIIQVGLGSDFVVEQCERHPDWLQTIVTEHALEADWQEAFKSGDLDWADFTWILYGEIARNEA